MKRWLGFLLTLCLLGMTPVATYAASSASFNNVPADHWAYASVMKLVKAGLVDGYSAETFHGDKPMNRYEFAIVIQKALIQYEKAGDDNQKTMDALTVEFASELNSMGARLAKVESKAETKTEAKAENKANTGMGGETRIRWVGDSPAQSNGNKLGRADSFEFRQRFKFWGTINENTSWAGRLSTTGGNKFGNQENTSGSTVSLDMAAVTLKNQLGLDTLRVGRHPLDASTNGLISKALGVDGVLVDTKLNDRTAFRAWTGNIKSNAYDYVNNRFADSQSYQLTTAEMRFNMAKNLTLKTGYYWSDVPGTSAANGMGLLNTNVGSFTQSQGWTASLIYKMGKYTLLADYVSTSLKNAQDLPDSPKGWAVQLSNSQGPPVFYSAANLVNPSKVGSDAWMISYRSIDAGAIPNGAGGFDTMAVANPAQPYNIFTHGSDNVNVLFLAYQKVWSKNTIMSLEYQDFRIKNRNLTNLASSNLDKTYMTKFEFFY
ncbi:MAG TPA: S-layer homology domain-containing protein [Patescibacteria group bacterium]|nr:S-layer homology domain-containing protein [Patescibacteria group bacterium]